MEKKYVMIIIFILIFVSGCSSIKRNYIREIENYDFPKINTETTVYLGQEMIIQCVKVKSKALKVNQPIDGVCYDFPIGKYEIIGQDDKKLYFSSELVQRASLCDPHAGLFIYRKNPDKINLVTIYGLILSYPGDFEIIDTEKIATEEIQRTLLFSGVKGTELEFMYTERSGLNTHLTHYVHYDISKNKVIGYRGAKIKIISYTNESITYEVLNNFPYRE